MVAVRLRSTSYARARCCACRPPLAAGDVVAVVAPSSPFPRDELWRGLAWLRQRYRLPDGRRAARARRRTSRAATHARAEEMRRAWLDPEVKAIVAARGGYGAMRILDAVPWAELVQRPRWLVGFSDVTALHAMAWRAGVGLGARTERDGARARRDAVDPGVVARLPRAPVSPRTWDGLRVVHPGRASGRRSRREPLASCTPWPPRVASSFPQGRVLALEDVTEAPYRVDRMLTSLRLAGHLARASAIVFGGFDRCNQEPTGGRWTTCSRSERCDLGVPVLAGAPFGHGARNEAFVLGARARIEAARSSSSSGLLTRDRRGHRSLRLRLPRAAFLRRCPARPRPRPSMHLGEIVGDDDLLVELLAVAEPRRRARGRATDSPPCRPEGPVAPKASADVRASNRGSRARALARPQQLVGADSGGEMSARSPPGRARRRAASCAPSPAACPARSA